MFVEAFFGVSRCINLLPSPSNVSQSRLKRHFLRQPLEYLELGNKLQMQGLRMSTNKQEAVLFVLHTTLSGERNKRDGDVVPCSIPSMFT